jgi:dTDP-L-rhamnose 4-epimerase
MREIPDNHQATSVSAGCKVLVTGGAGFIGSHTVDLLLERGYEARILDNLQPRVHPRGKPAWVPREAEFFQGDVANPRDLSRALEGMSGVLHLAAYQDYLRDFSTFIHTNAESAALLFELIVSDPARYPVRKIVFASSQSVSGEGLYFCASKDGCPSGPVFRKWSATGILRSAPSPIPSGTHGVIRPGPRPLEQLRRGDWEARCPDCGCELEPLLTDEGTATPHTAYAISKYAIELLADRLGRRYNIPTACMRYTYVQGPRNSFYNAYSGIARRFALRIMQQLPPIIYEDGQQLRDYVNVRDVARANVLALESPEANFQVFNVGGGRAVTVNQFARIMLDAFGSNLELGASSEFRLGDTRHTVSDISRLETLGWKPSIPVEQNVREYVDWLQEQTVSPEYLLEAERVMREAGVVQAVAP